MGVSAKYMICFLQMFSTKLLILPVFLIIFVILVFLAILTIVVVKIMIGNLFAKPWSCIKTSVSVSFDGGKNYEKKFHAVCGENIVYLKYEVAAKAHGFFSSLRKCEIPFIIKTPKSQGLIVQLHKYSGSCNPEPKDNGIVTSNETKFSLWVKGKKTESALIVLKCTRGLDSANNSFYPFKLSFEDKLFQQYSKTITLDFEDAV